MEDSKIISLFFERSEQAIEELDSKYGPAVRKTAANILKDRLDVEECVNDTYLNTWNSIPPHIPDPLAAYVCRIARNLAVNRYHANHAEKRNGN
ncbi:MAG: sigma-70 family RNA polymerase sigma factor, partial [Oscillospiraceae bacterium]|nr:sigma-70 family RNA polymerase sigma factor [Oscillospiraceae bacterium]